MTVNSIGFWVLQLNAHSEHLSTQRWFNLRSAGISKEAQRISYIVRVHRRQKSSDRRKLPCSVVTFNWKNNTFTDKIQTLLILSRFYLIQYFPWQLYFAINIDWLIGCARYSYFYMFLVLCELSFYRFVSRPNLGLCLSSCSKLQFTSDDNTTGLNDFIRFYLSNVVSTLNFILKYNSRRTIFTEY